MATRWCCTTPVNIGMATAITDGLVVLVVRDCDRGSLAEIAQQTAGLLERARAGRFAGDDMSGGTFTVSNLGMLPVTEFAAIINPAGRDPRRRRDP
jgi:pyruvate dehydrogenase E2 component (dihydrolipoamide acetyltransferase)